MQPCWSDGRSSVKVPMQLLDEASDMEDHSAARRHPLRTSRNCCSRRRHPAPVGECSTPSGFWRCSGAAAGMTVRTRVPVRRISRTSNLRPVASSQIVTETAVATAAVLERLQRVQVLLVGVASSIQLPEVVGSRAGIAAIVAGIEETPQLVSCACLWQATRNRCSVFKHLT